MIYLRQWFCHRLGLMIRILGQYVHGRDYKSIRVLQSRHQFLLLVYNRTVRQRHRLHLRRHHLSNSTKSLNRFIFFFSFQQMVANQRNVLIICLVIFECNRNKYIEHTPEHTHTSKKLATNGSWAPFFGKLNNHSNGINVTDWHSILLLYLVDKQNAFFSS